MPNLRQQLVALFLRLEKLEPYPWTAVETWIAAAKPLVREGFPSHLDDFVAACEVPSWSSSPIATSGGGRWGGPAQSNFAEVKARDGAVNRGKAAAGRDRIAACVATLLALSDDNAGAPAAREPIETVLAILDAFPSVVRSLKVRRSARPPLTMEDEYDVQYLLGALLAVSFADVRPEEWTPSVAGNSSRVDFLLKAERLVVEVKFARPGHADKAITDELIVDTKRYATHPDCGTLVCFVYDPSHEIRNPRGMEHDLSGAGPPRVVVVVR
jgi:hypothetical protein